MSVHFIAQHRNNLLAYPAGYAPGFDPSHVAGRNVQFSAVSSGGGAVELRTGKRMPRQGTAQGGVHGALGPVQENLVNGDYSTFTGSATNFATCTLAAIFKSNTAGSGINRYITSNSTGGSGVQLGTGTTGVIGIDLYGVVGLSSGIASGLEIPYFCAASLVSTTLTNYVLVNLITGVTKTATSSGGTPNAPDGIYSFGNGAFNNFPIRGLTAAAMFSGSGMSMAELLQWAADPWSFWYPNPDDNLVGAQAAAAAAARRLASLGVG